METAGGIGQLSVLLDSPEIGRLVRELEATRWTGRPGFPIRTMVGLALVKSLYALPTWTRVVGLVADHSRLQRILGCEGDPPSKWAAYRFAEKLRDNGEMVERCIDSVVEGLKATLPTYGTNLAIDTGDMPAYASRRKRGGFFNYRLHAAVCTSTGLPVAWRVKTAKGRESRIVAPLLDAAKRRGAMAATVAMHKAYDNSHVYDECAARDCLPLIPLRTTTAVKRGEHRPPHCEHGEWTFAGSDRKRGAAKWRCPSGECAPASTWRKASRLHPLIPRETERWKAVYCKRAAFQREFGRLKHEWGLGALRMRGLEPVRLHADLTILTKLTCALTRIRAFRGGG
jgi:hypothetical protein